MVSGVSNGVGQGTSAALNNVAGTLGKAKGGARKFRFFRRQGSGLSTGKWFMKSRLQYVG